jgi:hypothetical protein
VFYVEMTPQHGLKYVQTILLPGNPLDIAISNSTSPPYMIIAIDSSSPSALDCGYSGGEVPRLVILREEQGQWKTSRSATRIEGLDDSTIDTSLVQLHNYLYTIEQLRKMDSDGATEQ